MERTTLNRFSAAVWGCVAPLFLGLFINVAESGTLTVERDGSGDFYVVQYAVDAAAPGDTILIGPGRYDDFFDVEAPAWTWPAVVWIQTDDLTFIGSGPGETIIGPEDYYDPFGVSSMVFCCFEGYDCEIRNLTIENTYTGIYWGHGELSVAGCALRHCDSHVFFWSGNGLVVRDSSFDTFYSLSAGVMTSGAYGVDILGCSFTGHGRGITLLSSSREVEIRNCEFGGDKLGINLAGSSRCHLSGCNFLDGLSQGIDLIQDSVLEIENCCIFGDLVAAAVGNGSRLTGIDCVFRGGNELGRRTVIQVVGPSASVAVQASHIITESTYAVYCENYWDAPVAQDLTNNYWETTDPDEVAELIWDVNDNREIHSVVHYLPMADGPVATEQSTWSAVKSLYRDVDRLRDIRD